MMTSLPVVVVLLFLLWLVLGRWYLLPFALGYAVLAISLDETQTAWGVPVMVFVFLPLFDALVPHRRSSGLPASALFARARSIAGRALLWCWVVVELVILTVVLRAVAQEDGVSRFVSLVVATGILTGGVGIIVAHELMHGRRSLERAAAELLMGLVLYPHFCIEHVRGHHARVATAADPASARRGMSLYSFLPRTLTGSLRSAIELEKQRQRSRRVKRWSLGNALLRQALLVAAVLFGAIAIGGWRGLVLMLGQAALAVVLLEAVNYIEHYGLERRRKVSGRLEAVAAHHSWDSDHYFTNGTLFNLGRHPDHHLHASRTYLDLARDEDAPRMPVGYTAMILMALVPPLWFAVMDRRLPPASVDT